MSFYTSVKNFFNNKQDKLSNWLDGTYSDNQLFYVKGTCLCRYIRDLKVLLVSADAIGASHSPFIRALIVQSGLKASNIIKVPQFVKGHAQSHTFTKEELFNVFSYKLETLASRADMNKANSKLVAVYNELLKLHNHKVINAQEILDKYKSTVDTVSHNADEFSDDVDKFIKSNTICDVVDIAFFNYPCEYNNSTEFKTLLRNKLDPSGNLAFLHVVPETGNILTDETLCGAPHVVLDKENARTFLIGHKAGTLKRGMKFGRYTIMAMRDGYYKIGCNNYPSFMFDGLYEVTAKLGWYED